MSGLHHLSRRFLKCTFGAFTILLLLMVGCYALIQYDDNFHVVDENRVFRSAQLDRRRLKQVIVENGIKSIINLRGRNDGKSWYEGEIQIASQFGVEHIDHALSASQVVSLQEMETLLDEIERAPKPLLIHCHGGADRTGLLAGLYLARHGYSKDEARAQLSIRYGHAPYLFYRDRTAMDASLESYLNKDVEVLTREH